MSPASASDTLPSWPEEIFAILQRFDVRQVPYVPDAGHSKLIQRVLASDTPEAIRRNPQVIESYLGKARTRTVAS